MSVWKLKDVKDEVLVCADQTQTFEFMNLWLESADCLLCFCLSKTGVH